MRFRDYLKEGTWSIPNDIKTAKKLESLFKKPILAKNYKKSLYNLVGDDDLFDSIEDAFRSEDKDKDIRSMVAGWIDENWIKKFDKIDWLKEWDPEALKIVKNIVKKYK